LDTRASFTVIKEHAIYCAGRSGKERERNKELEIQREREKDNLYQTTFGLVKIGKIYTGVGKERKKKKKKKLTVHATA